MNELPAKDVAAEVTRPSAAAKGHLPRLAPEFYRGHAVVFWTHTVADRATGWLSGRFHGAFRETMLHAAARENLLCPIYVLMPDHLHLVWMGIADTSDQRTATTFVRTQLEPFLAPHIWQHQPHDHVLRENEREHDAFASTWHYIAENPVRKGLVSAARDWPYLGSIAPGYPRLHPLDETFPSLFWRIYAVAAQRGRAGKI